MYAELGPGYDVERAGVGPHTLNEGNIKMKLVEALADDTEFHSTPHDVQKDVWKTNDLQIS